MTDPSLGALFCPRSIAVVGGSGTPTKIGGVPIDLLLRCGDAGRIVPINPKAAEIQGLPAYPTLCAVGEPVDLAVFAIPEAVVPAAIDDAIAAGTKAVVLFSAGYAEVGPEGEAAQARARGLRLIGPTCLGIMNVREHVYATFSPAPGIGRAPGLSVWASTGNEVDVQVADVIEWMAHDPNTQVIMAYIEGCRDGDRLRRALAAAHAAHAAKKPVVVVKVGRTALGAQAARSHTASLAGDDAVYDALFRQYGVYRARDIQEFFDVAHGAAVAGLPRNDRIALFTLSGGVGAFMADEAASVGLDVAETSAGAQRQILDWVPFAALRNPIDITGQVSNDRSLIDRATRVVLEGGDYGAWLGFMAAAGAGDGFWPVLEQLSIGLRRDHPDTFLAISTLLNDARRDRLAELGVQTFAEPAAIAAAAPAGARFAVKVVSPDILHKTDVGGVRLGVTAEDAAAAFDAVTSAARRALPSARIDGALLAPMVAGGVECILGARDDPVFGPVVIEVPDTADRYYVLGFLDFWNALATADALLDLGEAGEAAAARGGWSLPRVLGESFGQDRHRRAVVARRYIGALASAEAFYPMAHADSAGRPLSGEHRYTIRFPPACEPPVDCFWSLTMYDSRDCMLVPNAIERYRIGDRSLGLVRDGDGGLTLRLQHASPGPSLEPNGLPAPQGRFYLCLRAYKPRPELLDGRWRAPDIVRAD
jgi:acyl-CoA synthetase (NDP forming)